MDVSTRLYSMAVEAVFMPAQLDEKKCRGIFDRVSDSHSITAYQSLPDSSVMMSSKDEKSNLSRYRISKDRLAITYDFCSQSMNYYQAMADDFIKVFTEITGNSMFLMHSVVIRKLVNIKGVEDGRGFLISKVLAMKDESFKTFGRPLHAMGTRMFFPPMKDDMAAFDVKIESWMEDYRTLFVECAGVYSTPVDLKANSAGIGNDITRTDEFIGKNIMGFLAQFNEGI